MDFVTSTDLRTQTASLIQALHQGKTVALVHRSKVIGDVVPRKNQSLSTPNFAQFNAFMDRLGNKLPRKDLSPEERQKAYHQHLKAKYG